MSSLEPRKNNENYFVIKVDGKEVEDVAGLCRSYWKCVEKDCPFSGCTDNAWNRVKSDLWSVESEDHVRAYLKQHGMESTLHGRNKTFPMPEDIIDANVRDADIQEIEDTWEERQKYKSQMNLQEQGRKRKRDKKNDDDDQWQGDQWQGRSGSSWQGEQPDLQPQILEAVASLAQGISVLAQGKASSSAEPPKALMTGPSNAELRAVPAFIESAMDASMELDNGATLSINEKMVSVPFSTLMLCKETTQRSKEACKQALASMLTPMSQLRVELGVLNNAEQVLDGIIESAKKS